MTGSFVDEQVRSASSGLESYASPSPLLRAAIGLTLVASGLVKDLPAFDAEVTFEAKP